MATIKCVVPGCGFDVDLSTACIDVTSLLGLRVIVEKRLEGIGDNPTVSNEHKKQLVTINRYLKHYFPEPERLEEQVTKLKNADLTAIKSTVKHLYLKCTNPKPNPDGQHRAYYDVTCNEIDDYAD